MHLYWSVLVVNLAHDSITNQESLIEWLSQLGWPLSKCQGYLDCISQGGKPCPLWVAPLPSQSILYCMRSEKVSWVWHDCINCSFSFYG